MVPWWGNKQKKLLNRTKWELLKCNNNTGLNLKNIFYIRLLENWAKTLCHLDHPVPTNTFVFC